MNTIIEKRALDIVKRQRNFVLFVLSNAREGKEEAYEAWFKSVFKEGVQGHATVARVRMYRADEVDVTFGRFKLVPMKYLAVVDIVAQGSENTEALIDYIYSAHKLESSGRNVAAWLYYPAGEKFGLDMADTPVALLLHYANPVVGREAEFAEWFASRLTRRAPEFAPLVSGQRFERTLFQKPGALEAKYQTIGVYEQAGPSERLIDSFKNPPPNALNMESIDVENEQFTESTYLPLT